MKNILPAFVLLIFILPFKLSAQYSNATFSGPWLVSSQSNLYIIFDGAGHITELGQSSSVAGNAGTYNVFSGDSFTAVINQTYGPGHVTGTIISDTSAILYYDSMGPYGVIKVSNPGALADSLVGYLFDSTTYGYRPIALAINDSGHITAGSGLSGISGKIFTQDGVSAGLIKTTEDTCYLQYIAISGFLAGNILNGAADIGIEHDTASNCNHNGYVELTRKNAGPSAVNNIPAPIDFSVHPNPFSNQLEIIISSPIENTTVEVLDMLGRKLYSQQYNNMTNIMLSGMDNWANGVYLLNITNGSGMISKKIIKY